MFRLIHRIAIKTIEVGDELLFAFRIWLNEYKIKKEISKYKGRAVGEVVRVQKEERTDWWLLLFGPNNGYRKNRYSPIVKYEVNGEEFEIDALDYSENMPVVGRKALVYYSEYFAFQACVVTKRQHKGRLHVVRKDNQYVYCTSGSGKQIKIPIELTDNQAVPGRYLVEKYGYYHLEQPEDRMRSQLQDMANETVFHRD